MKVGKTNISSGFTIVELLIVIVVIAILAAISLVTFTGIAERGAKSAVTSSLQQVGRRALAEDVSGGNVRELLNDILTSDSNILYSVRYDTGGDTNYYPNLSPVQEAFLLVTLCKNLISEGYGTGPDDFGSGTVPYLTSCDAYTANNIQINGWAPLELTDGTSRSMLQAYVERTRTGHPNHPSFAATAQTFVDELIARFERSGGTFPVTEFWNNWDTPNIPSLPPPEVRTVEDGYFCITAQHRNYENAIFTITSRDTRPREGASC